MKTKLEPVLIYFRNDLIGILSKILFIAERRDVRPYVSSLSDGMDKKLPKEHQIIERKQQNKISVRNQNRLLTIAKLKTEAKLFCATESKIAKQVLNKSPKQGYLTISNALQWSLNSII